MDTRAALLDSAEHASRMRGYDGFSYADLSKDVGIRKASIHHHFPTKADLADALLQRYRERFFEGLATIKSRHAKGSARIEAYLGAYRDALSGGKMVCLCVAFSAGRDSLSDSVLAELNRFNDLSIAWLTETFRLGRDDGSIASDEDPQSEAAACLALVEGAQLLARAAKDVSRFDAAIATLVRRIG